MNLKKNIRLGKIRSNLFILILFLIISFDTYSSDNLEGGFTDIKILDTTLILECYRMLKRKETYSKN